MDVHRIAEAADLVGETRPVAVVGAVELVVAPDAAALAHAEQRSGLREVGVLEAGDMFPVELMVDLCDLPPLDISSGQLFSSSVSTP